MASLVHDAMTLGLCMVMLPVWIALYTFGSVTFYERNPAVAAIECIAIAYMLAMSAALTTAGLYALARRIARNKKQED